jgi:hypothetical protein
MKKYLDEMKNEMKKSSETIDTRMDELKHLLTNNKGENLMF